MNLDLFVDTSRKGVSMALSANEYVEIVDTAARGETLGALLDTLLAQMNTSLDDIKRVMVTVGPGSFSGLRTGVAFCQGLCLSGKRELYGVTTLQALECFGTNGDQEIAKSTAVIIRARNGYWYVRLNGTESFTETSEAVDLVKNAQVKTIVLDEAAAADETLQATFKELAATTVLDTGKKLNMWAPLFNTITPNLIQEANYIQPSYFEKLKPSEAKTKG